MPTKFLSNALESFVVFFAIKTVILLFAYFIVLAPLISSLDTTVQTTINLLYFFIWLTWVLNLKNLSHPLIGKIGRK